MMGGVAVKRVCAEALEKGRRIAAHLLQADSAAVTFADGRFAAGGGSITLAEVAAVAADPERLPDGMEPGFDARYTLHQESMNFPNGCHVCEVEVDEETGLVEIVRYTACDDDGVLLNPLIVHGQVHGGVAQGLGQALLENPSSTTPKPGNSSLGRTWITGCRGRTTSPPSRPYSIRFRAGPTISA
jgi:carbon-monoxide dehydrogenase large subunit